MQSLADRLLNPFTDKDNGDRDIQNRSLVLSPLIVAFIQGMKLEEDMTQIITEEKADEFKKFNEEIAKRSNQLQEQLGELTDMAKFIRMATTI